MKCYYHPDYDAVGICKNCQKGICKECVTEIDTSLACKDRCEEDVKRINFTVEKSYQMLQTRLVQSTHSGGAIVYTILGILFILYGLFIIDLELAYLLIPAGCAFLLAGYMSFRNSKKLNPSNPPD